MRKTSLKTFFELTILQLFSSTNYFTYFFGKNQLTFHFFRFKFHMHPCECTLWEYCKRQGIEKEMFDFARATNLLTFRRMCSSSQMYASFAEKMRDTCFELFNKLNDDNLRNDMIFIVRSRIDEEFQEDFLTI